MYPIRRLAVALLPLAVLAGACGNDATTSAPSATAPAPTPSSAAAPGTTAASGPTSSTTTSRPGGATPKTTAVPATSTALVLKANGLGDISLGTPADDAMARLTPKLGPAEPKPGPDSVCPGHTSAYWPAKDVAVWFDTDGNFEGWTVRKAGSGATADGVGVGTDLPALRRNFGDKLHVGENSLGHGWWAEGVSPDQAGFVGLLDQPGEAGRVISIWSGFTCTAH
jgi:hypothetical protein